MQIVLEKDEFLKAFENLFELGTCAVLRSACRLPFAPLVYRSLFLCVFLSLFSFPVIVRSSICFPYPLSFSLFHIFPPLSHISFPHPYLISSLPYLISLFLTPISYLPSPISYLLPSPPLSLHISSFPLLPYPLSSPSLSLFHISFPLLSSLPIPSYQDGFVVLPGGTCRPRWCNAQECMERPMSVYIRVYTFARPLPASSAVSSLSGVGGFPWSRARARISYYCKPTRKEGGQIFIHSLFFQKKKYKKIISITSFSLVQSNFS